MDYPDRIRESLVQNFLKCTWTEFNSLFLDIKDSKKKYNCVVVNFRVPAKNLKKLKSFEEEKSSLSFQQYFVENVEVYAESSQEKIKKLIELFKTQPENAPLDWIAELPIHVSIILVLIKNKTTKSASICNPLIFPYFTWPMKEQKQTFYFVQLRNFFHISKIFDSYYPEEIELSEMPKWKNFAPFTLKSTLDFVSDFQIQISNEVFGKYCSTCKKKSIKKNFPLCGQCKVTRYCSKECQKKDFASHKHLCFPSQQFIAPIRMELQI